MKITIVTTTYNRLEKIKNLYNHLRKQTVGGFEWLIIDDGSTDGTGKEIDRFKKNKNRFNISYYKKSNGGKHTALNMAFGLIKTELFMIVDSDDYLIDNGIEIILKDWSKYGNNNVCGLCYKRMDKDGKPICDDFGKRVVVANYRDFIINGKIMGDKAEVFRADVFCERRFPEFKGEKFLSEGVLWCEISRQYDTVFINKSIYVCEYLENGLTRCGRRLRINNPLGGMYCAKEFLKRDYRFGVREKNALLFLVYSRFAPKESGKRMIPIGKQHKLILKLNKLPSFFLYKYWLNKYGVEND